MGGSMAIHYNAFISYRHHPEDIKVAEEIQHRLERYRIPGALRKKGKKINRIFRDKEELPITSNISDDISLALENSDFLIVICSVHTCESVWVRREIEAFLKTHDRNRVLTVLVNGEPGDTIPDILLNEERIDPKTGAKELLPIEPLSCDWRVNRRKARREELPRLAAALLGCGYDELRQRERQYRTRRLITGISIALLASICLLSYFIYTSIQIQEANDRLTDANIQIRQNLEEAQMNQSRYLASSSRQQLEDGDRLLAIRLALEGLPKQEGDRPYVAEAELALSKAIGVYHADDEIQTVGAITCEDVVTQFQATDDREWMYTIDRRNVLTVWEMSTSRPHSSVRMDVGIEKMVVTAQGNALILNNEDSLYCYDKECKLLWQTEMCVDLAFSEDHKTLLMRSWDNSLQFLDPDTGEQVRKPIEVYLQPEDKEKWYYSFCQNEYDLTKPILLAYTDHDETRLIAINGEVVSPVAQLGEDEELINTAVMPDGSYIAAVRLPDGLFNGRFLNMYTRGAGRVRLYCYAADGTDALWQAELNTYSYTELSTIMAIPDRAWLFAQIDSVCVVLDREDGTVVHSCELGAAPVFVKAEAEKATIMQEDGSYGIYSYENNQFNYMRAFKENIAAGFIGKGAYINQIYSNQILMYKSISDENRQLVEGNCKYSWREKAQWGTLVALRDYSGIYLFDMKQQKLMWYAEQQETDSFCLLGFSKNGETVWISNGDALTAFDTATGSRQDHAPEQYLEEGMLSVEMDHGALMSEDAIYFMAKDPMGQYYLMRFEISEENLSYNAVEYHQAPVTTEMLLLAGGEHTAVTFEKEANILYLVDLQTGELQILSEDVSQQPVVQYVGENGCFVLCVEGNVLLYDTTGSRLFSAETGDAKGVSCCLTEKELLVLLDSGVIQRYDPDGEKLNEIQTERYDSFSNRVSIDFEPDMVTWQWIDEDTLFVNMITAGNLIECNQWARIAFVPNCIAYLPQLDQFLTTGNNSLGVYNRYGLRNLQEMAEQILGSYTLTEEQRAGYGIS